MKEIKITIRKSDTIYLIFDDQDELYDNLWISNLGFKLFDENGITIGFKWEGILFAFKMWIYPVKVWFYKFLSKVRK